LTRPRGRPLIVGNWKMNLDEAGARRLAEAVAASLPLDRVDAAVAPPFPFLRAVAEAIAGSEIALGAQNVHWDDRGAYTGEVAAPMLAGLGVRYVIVGHSERRALFGETDAEVARKLVAVRRHGMVPIACVGETERERDAGRTIEVVVSQVRAAFADLAIGNPTDLVVAYEPVWAIGTGRTPVAADVTAAHAAIREALRERFGASAREVRILYGGSVTAASAPALLRAPEVGGALVGGASLDPASFAAIAEAAA